MAPSKADIESQREMEAAAQALIDQAEAARATGPTTRKENPAEWDRLVAAIRAAKRVLAQIQTFGPAPRED